MHRYLVTGTDTDVGKTRVTAMLALALKRASNVPTVVKLVQTGVAPGAPGDAERAGRLSGCAHQELARFLKPSDPWNAALAEALPPVQGQDLKRALEAIEGPIVAEGAGGLAVPLNSAETFADVAECCGLSVVVVVGLRLGCINHALLTAALLGQRRIGVAGAVLCERFGPTEATYHDDVLRALQGKLDVLGIIPFDVQERRSVDRGAQIFRKLVG